MDYKEIRESKGNKSITTESNTETTTLTSNIKKYNDLNENKINDKKERKKMGYVERRKLFKRKFEGSEN